MDGRALAKRAWMRVAHAPRDVAARDGVVLAIDDVADPPDGLTERDPDDADVEHEADRQTQPARGEVTGDGRADRCAHSPDAAAPELKRAQRVVRVQGPVVRDMRDARADESTDDDRDREGIDPLVAHQVARAADRHERSSEHSDEGEDRVPGDAE